MSHRLSRLSEISEESYDSSKAPNFSRPRPSSYESQQRVAQINSRDSNVHSLSAFYEPNRDLPDEPRFSLESERTETTTSDNSAGSDFAWDGRTGELVARPRRKQFDDQRYMKPSTKGKRPETSKTTASDNSMSTFARRSSKNSDSSSSAIHKRVSVDVESDRMSTYEDTASHHTVSDDEEDAETGSYGADGEWRSSDYDTSGLSDAKIRKLLRKGVNPSLYAEMQAAKKKSKSKWIGPLVGNSFIG